MDERTPVIIGAGQVTVRLGEESLEPVALMAEALRRAADDSGGVGVLDAAGSIRVVDLLSCRYADPGGLVAAAMGLSPAETVVTTPGGNSVGLLISRTATSILDGDLDVALLTGAEAWRTRSAARREGTDLGWITEPEGAAPDLVLGTPLDMSHPVEQALGIWHPIEMYPLFEDALRARAGRDQASHAALLGRLWSRASEVAATNPHAWDRQVHTADEIAAPSPANRMVVTPYTKLLCSNEMVDQGAALIMCSVAAARALGVPPDRWVFPVAAAEAKAPPVSERCDLWSSPMIGAAGRALRAATGVGPDDVAHVDLYSCFPSAVEIQAAELGFDLERELTVAGGMRFFGGPWNNYPMHAMASIVERLRDDPSSLALCSFNGGFLTKQVTSLFSGVPPVEPFRSLDAQPDADAQPRREVDPAPAGPATVEAAVLAHDREGPTRGVIAALLPDGRRGWGIVAEPTALRDLAGRDLVGCGVDLHDGAATVTG